MPLAATHFFPLAMICHPFRAIALSTLVGSFALTACGGGGGGGGGAPPPVDPVRSSFLASPAFGASADGTGKVKLDLVLADADGNPVPGSRVVFEATGFDNAIVQPPATNSLGATQGSMTTTVGEKKSIIAVINPGPDEIRLGPVTTEFLRILPNWRFVRTSGSDLNDGRTPLKAWRTLAQALTQIGPGNVLFVGAGTYPETPTITTVATAEAPLVIRGDTLGEFTGDPGEVLIDAGGGQYGIQLLGASHVTLRGLSVRGSDNGIGQGGGIFAGGASHCSILACRMYENRRGMHLFQTTDMWVEDNRISVNRGDGARISQTVNTHLRGNLVYANDDDGIELNPPSTNITIDFNTFYRNAGDQIREPVPGTTGMVGGNVLTEGTGLGLGLATTTLLTSVENLSWLQTGNTPGTAFVANPMFVDPIGRDGILGGIGAEDDDFRVEVLSPTLDMGTEEARSIELVLSGSLASRGSRQDDLLDGEGLDQRVSNLGFHQALPLDPFTTLEPRGARAAFARMGEARVRTRAWNRTNDQWAAGVKTLAIGSDVRWLVQRVSTGPKPEEIVAAQIDTGVGARIVVRTWDARRWSDDTPTVLTTVIDAANADERAFDVELEALSSHALFVHADGAANVVFRRLQEGVWSTPAPVFTPALATGTVLWTELVPRPGTNEIALVALDDQQMLIAAIWDGTRWTRQILLATQVNSLRDFKAFDAAWESLSGDLLVAWGHSQFSEETRYATLVRATDTWTTGQFVSTDALGMFVVLASDPTSDRIAAIFGEGLKDDDVGVSNWTGTQWYDTAELSLAGHSQSRAMEVAWLGRTGLAFALYRDKALKGSFQWASLNPGGWKRQPEVALPGVGKMVQAETRIVPGTDRVMMLMLDENGSLWATECDGTTWVVKNGGAPLATGLDPANPGRSFDFDLRGL